MGERERRTREGEQQQAWRAAEEQRETGRRRREGDWRNELLVEENRCVRIRIRRGGGGRIKVRVVYMAGLRAPRMFPALFRIYGFHYCWLVVVGYTGTD